MLTNSRHFRSQVVNFGGALERIFEPLSSPENVRTKVLKLSAFIIPLHWLLEMEIRACCQYLGTPFFVSYGCVPWLRIKPFPDAGKTKEMFYGLVASVDDNFLNFERDVLWSDCICR